MHSSMHMAEDRDVPATPPFLTTPEGILLLTNKANDKRVPTASETSAATLLAVMMNSMMHGNQSGKSRRVVHADFAICLEGVVVDISPSAEHGQDLPLTAEGQDSDSSLALVVRGLQGDDQLRFPLEKASSTKWILEGFIQLPKKVMDLEIIAEWDHGGLGGSVTIAAEELREADRSPSDGVQRLIAKEMSRSDPCLTLTLKVGTMLTKNTHMTTEPDPESARLQVEEGMSALNEGLDLFKLCRGSKDPAKFAEVAECLEKAASLLPPTSSERLNALAGLSITFRSLFDMTGNTNALDGSIAASQKAIATLSSLSAQGDEGIQRFLCFASMRHAADLLIRYERFGKGEDIDGAILSQRLCLSLVEELGDAGTQWGNLGSFLLRRFERFGQIDDINEAVEAQEIAATQIPEGDINQPWALANLGSALYARFKRTGDVMDLEQGISHLKDAHSRLVGPTGANITFAFISNNLAGALMRRFQRFGGVVDLNDAIAAYHQVLHITPDNDPIRFTLLNNLSLALNAQYSHSRQVETVMESVDILKLAVQATPDGHSTLPLTLNNLATTLMELFERTKDVAHIKESIEAQEIAIATLPEGHPSLPCCYDNLGVQFQFLFKLNQEIDAIENAVNAHRRAVDHSSADLTEYPVILYNFGQAIRLRWSLAPTPGFQPDMGESISVTETALDMVPEGHSFRATLFHSLGESHYVRFSLTKDISDMKSATNYYAKAALSVTSPPGARLEVTRKWCQCTMLQMDSEQSLTALNVGVELIAQVAGMEQTVERRYEQIPQLSFFVLNAVAFGIMIERLDKALEWLEQGRGLVWNQLSSLRTPLDTLNTVDPALAEGFRDVCKRLERAGAMERTLTRSQASMDQKMTLHDEAASHFKLAKEREDLLRRIRTSVPGFENFLQSPPPSALFENLPEAGAVVILSIHPLHCDAIVLRAGFDGPTHIPLPGFSYDRAIRLRKLLHNVITAYGLGARCAEEEEEEEGREGGEEAESRGMKKQIHAGPKDTTIIEDILRELWVDVAKPIIDALDIQPFLTKPTRIWWCATGPSTFLPIHAAGIYRGSEAVALDDYVASSYIPTITSLTDRVKDAAERVTPETKSGLLLITQPEAPGLPHIPGTRTEVEKINKHANEHGIRSLRLDDNQATVEAGLKAMEDYSCVHLACHARQDSRQPLKSGFYLNDGRLELSAIVKMHFQSADFAFLSACQTSMGSDDLSEEAVHLAAGMLAAGYRGVVATMWSIQDGYAVELADDFYADLLSSNNMNREKRVVEGWDAAYSLHYAVRALRHRHGNSETSFLAWVPYVHYGL